MSLAFGQVAGPSGLIDAIRIVAITLAGIAMILMAARAHRARIQNGDHFAVFATAALIDALAFVVYSQAIQIGGALRTWWGLPWLISIVLLTIGALWRSKV
jgi:hypothetical protein